MGKEVTVRYMWAVLAVLTAGCGGEPAARRVGDSAAVADTAAGRLGGSAARELGGGDAAGVVLVVGTSLTAGLGVDPSEAYPARLQEKIDAARLPFRVVNAGVSGETSAGALARMEWLLQQRPAVLLVETGANDGLRGLDPEALESNLTAIVQRTRAAAPEAEIAIVQMEAPPNLGRGYTGRFREAYGNVAREQDVTLLPFPLVDVAGVDSLNQPDGIHPTPSGHRRMADAIWPALEPLLRDAAVRARRAALR
jgi:acyl-CoA thioesterase-1